MNRASLNNRSLKPDILRLRSEGKSYNQIAKTLNCSKSVISYHCGGGSEKARVLSVVRNRKAICRKVSRFKTRCSRKNYAKLSSKLKTFKRKSNKKGNHTNTIVNSIDVNYTCKDVLNKIGANPICYLTGTPINLDDSASYHLDHIIPTSRGGSNNLDNLEICLKDVNTAKGQLMIEEFYDLCEKVLQYRDSQK